MSLRTYLEDSFVPFLYDWEDIDARKLPGQRTPGLLLLGRLRSSTLNLFRRRWLQRLWRSADPNGAAVLKGEIV